MEQVGLLSFMGVPGSYGRFLSSGLHPGWSLCLKWRVQAYPLLKVEVFIYFYLPHNIALLYLRFPVEGYGARKYILRYWQWRWRGLPPTSQRTFAPEGDAARPASRPWNRPRCKTFIISIFNIHRWQCMNDFVSSIGLISIQMLLKISELISYRWISLWKDQSRTKTYTM